MATGEFDAIARADAIYSWAAGEMQRSMQGAEGPAPLGSTEVQELLTFGTSGRSARRAAHAVLILGSPYFEGDRMDPDQLAEVRDVFDVPEVRESTVHQETQRFRHSRGPVVLAPLRSSYHTGVLAAPVPDERPPFEFDEGGGRRPEGQWTAFTTRQASDPRVLTPGLNYVRFGRELDKGLGIHPFGRVDSASISRDHLTLSVSPDEHLVVDERSKYGTRVIHIPEH